MSGRPAARLLVGDGLAAAAIEGVAGSEPVRCLILTGRMFRQLGRELGGGDAAARWLLDLAERHDLPIGVNVEVDPERAQSIFIAPRSWSTERLRGWIGGHHEELVEMFGAVDGPPYPWNGAPSPNRAERRRRTKGA